MLFVLHKMLAYDLMQASFHLLQVLAMTDENYHAKGGAARARSLTPEQRSEIAKKAAKARWEDDSPVATHEGVFSIGNTEIFAAVLPDGSRIISQAALLRAIGRSRSPKAGTGILNTVDKLPFFLQAKALGPFIDNELIESTTPVFFKTENGKKSVGYKAEALPAVAETYLRMRDGYHEVGKAVPKSLQHIVKASDLITRGLAQVGIVALIDEATGYRQQLEHQELQRILDKWMTGYARKWAKTFPDQFWEKLLRVKGFETYIGHPRPQFVGHWVNDIVYKRLAPGVHKKVKDLNPSKNGTRKHKHHQFLSEDHGVPELKEHIMRAMTLFDVVLATGQDLELLLDKVMPRYGDSLQLDLDHRD